MSKMGVIGYGYWGPRSVRNFQSVNDCQVAVVCDKNPETLRRAKQAFLSTNVSIDPSDATASTGDMWAPKIEQTEALSAEAKYFVDCLSKALPPVQRWSGWPAGGQDTGSSREGAKRQREAR